MRFGVTALVIIILLTVGVGPVIGTPQSDAVRCSYDESELREYQPETVIEQLSVQPTASYGGIFSSPEHDTTIYVYFLYYETQVGMTPLDSHENDREPVYVVVDQDTDEIQRVQYSAYHYMKASATPENLSMNGSHVQLHVNNPWHHYRPTDAQGTYTELKNYCAVVDQWLASGWQAAPNSVRHPWTMSHRASWWEEGSVRNRIFAQYQETQSSLDNASPGLVPSFN